MEHFFDSIRVSNEFEKVSVYFFLVLGFSKKFFRGNLRQTFSCK